MDTPSCQASLPMGTPTVPSTTVPPPSPVYAKHYPSTTHTCPCACIACPAHARILALPCMASAAARGNFDDEQWTLWHLKHAFGYRRQCRIAQPASRRNPQTSLLSLWRGHGGRRSNIQAGSERTERSAEDVRYFSAYAVHHSRSSARSRKAAGTCAATPAYLSSISELIPASTALILHLLKDACGTNIRGTWMVGLANLSTGA